MPIKAFALRINEELFKAVEQWASDEFSSTNGQIEHLINQAVKKQTVSGNRTNQL
ncbi:MAG: Arc family DNA binding domain-containing protein [Leeuwenhoekiella sp.]